MLVRADVVVVHFVPLVVVVLVLVLAGDIVVAVGPENLALEFGQNGVSNSSDIVIIVFVSLLLLLLFVFILVQKHCFKVWLK